MSSQSLKGAVLAVVEGDGDELGVSPMYVRHALGAAGRSVGRGEVALALEGLVALGLVDRIRVQGHGGAVSKVRYRRAQPERQRRLF